MRPATRALLIGAAASALLASGAAKAEQADEAQDAVTLDTVVVQSATADPSAPAGTVTTRTTTREAIDNRLVNDIQDLGRTEEAGISFNRTTNSINIRGLEGPRVLTTIDGVRVPYLSDATRGAVGGADTFDFSALSSLDLTRGADPLLGSGAVGGVLAVRTLDPEDLLLGGRRVGVLAKTGYDSTDRNWFTSNAVALRSGDTSALLQGGYRTGHERDTQGELDTFGPTRTEPNPRDTDSYNLLGKLYQEVEGGHRFGLVGEVFNRKDEIDGRTTQAATGTYRPGNYFAGEEVERHKAALTYDFRAPERGSGWIDDATAVLYYQDVRRDLTVDALRSAAPLGLFTRDNSYEDETVGFNGTASRDWQLGSVEQRLTVGTELFSTKTTQYSAGVDGCLVNPSLRACSNLHTNQADTPEIDSRAAAIYGENETRLLEDRLRLTPGIRVDWIRAEPQLTDSYRENPTFNGTLPPAFRDVAASPKFLAEFDLQPDLTLYGQYTRGFRAPTVGELYSRFGAVGTYLRVGNEDLESETSDGFDAGVRFGGEELGAQVNLFTARYRNFIDVVTVAPPGGLYPQGGISSYRNIPDARLSGVELNGHLRFLDRWRARASVAYTEGRNLTDDTYLDSVPPLTAILGLGYERAEWGGEVSTKLVARRDKVDDGFVAPGYGVLDLTAWYAPERLPGFKISGGVFNILDKTYYDAVNVPETRSQPALFYSEPGRSFKVNALYRF